MATYRSRWARDGGQPREPEVLLPLVRPYITSIRRHPIEQPVNRWPLNRTRA